MWLSVISRQARNTAIGQGGDVAYRLVLLCVTHDHDAAAADCVY